MKKIKLLAAYTLATLTLVSCSNNASLSNDLNSAGDSIVRFVNGTFYAEIYNTSLQSVYNATLLALNNSNIYSVKNNTINSKDAEITGTYTTDKISLISLDKMILLLGLLKVTKTLLTYLSK